MQKADINMADKQGLGKIIVTLSTKFVSFYHDIIDWWSHITDRFIDEDPKLRNFKIYGIVATFGLTIAAIYLFMNLHNSFPYSYTGLFYIYFLFIPAVAVAIPFGRRASFLSCALIILVLLFYLFRIQPGTFFMFIVFIPSLMLIPIIYQVGFSLDKYRGHLRNDRWRFNHGMTNKIIEMEERKKQKLSQQIHANTLHSLAYVALKLENSSNMPNDAVVLVRDSIEDIRKYMRELNSNPVEELGLEKAIIKEVEKLEQNGNCNVHLDVDIPPLKKAYEHLIYQIVSELLINILKHARANRAYIYLRENSGIILLQVTDNGIGFKPSKASSNSYGLKLLENQIKFLTNEKGLLRIYSILGGGTIIKAKIPLKKVKRKK